VLEALSKVLNERATTQNSSAKTQILSHRIWKNKMSKIHVYIDFSVLFQEASNTQ